MFRKLLPEYGRGEYGRGESSRGEIGRSEIGRSEIGRGEFEKDDGNVETSSPLTPKESRMVHVIQIVICVIFVYLWFTADTSQGSLSRPLWYGAAISLAILSTSSVCTHTRISPMGLVPFVSPLIFIMLYETIVQDMDRGTKGIQFPLWVGRFIAVLVLASVSYSFVRGGNGVAAAVTGGEAAGASSASFSGPSLASRILGSYR